MAHQPREKPGVRKPVLLAKSTTRRYIDHVAPEDVIAWVRGMGEKAE